MQAPLSWAPLIPSGYSLTENGWSVAERRRGLRSLTYAPLFPAAMLEDEAGNRIVDLLYYAGKSWKHTLVYLKQLGTTPGIRALSAKGVPISLGSPGQFLRFLDAFLKANPDIPGGVVRDRGGWDSDRYWWGAYHLDGKVKRGGWQSPDPYLQSVIGCQAKGGDREASFRLFEEAMSPALAVFLSAACASVLLRPLGIVGGFCVHLTSPSSTGKTTLLEIVASFFGRGLVRSWTEDQKWIRVWQDAPIFLDESTRVSTSRAGFIIHLVSTMPSVLLSNGELPITDRNGLHGVTARTLSVCMEPFSPQSPVDAWKQTARDNYGHGFEWLLGTLNRDNVGALSQLYVSMMNETMRAGASGIALRQKSYTSAVYTAAHALQPLFPSVYTLAQKGLVDSGQS